MKNVLEYLEDSVEKFPLKTAFEDEHTSCSYSELEKRAKKIGSALSKFTMPQSPVAFFMDKSVDAAAGFLGAVYAGCFYVFIDTKQPASRIRHILDILENPVLITTQAYLEEKVISDLGLRPYLLENLEMTRIDEPALQAVRRQSLDIDPLYGIFTSGSTGTPKGVLVSHRSVIDFIDVFTDLFDIHSNDVIGNQAPFDFDVSVKDIYSTLKTGATMEIIPKKLFSFPMPLLDFLCERKVTTLIWAVSALCIISALGGFKYKVPHEINKVLFSGEVMPVKHFNEWKKYLPDAVYVNLYGPTEITCNCAYYIIDRDFAPGDVIPIGRAFPNERIFLLDADERLVTSPDTKGEICVSGTALSLGYYNNPTQTAAAFVQNPLNKNYLETIYRTGDLGYYNGEGELCFSGRKDFQIKHMGHRIELGEIEAAVEKQNGIIRVCCIFDMAKNKIVAFYQGTPDKKAIVHGLREQLPPFMIPSSFIRVEKMPLTKNGKIDRGALREMEDGA